MKTGTVRWFNLQKGYGFIHPDDGSHSIIVYKSAAESAGMSDLKGGQRLIFETQENERRGDLCAISLKVLAPETTVHRSFDAPNPFDVSAFISYAMSPLLPG